MELIRFPVAAGSFYPANKTNLINQINGFFKKTKKLENKEKPRILIVPHAGYIFSGQTAAWGFKQLKDNNYTRIIIIAPSHWGYFNKAVIYNKGSWQTPLGKILIDETFASTLINQSALIEPNLNIYQREHSIEVEIPFLQQSLNNFKIVPILLSQPDNKVLESLTKAIINNFNEQTLLVISSDLSHYPSDKIAVQVDWETIEAILTGDVNQFSQKIKQNLNQPGVETCACGAEAIKAGMMIATQLGLKTIKLINYANSSNTSGDKSRVVGYASICFYGELATKIQKKLNKKQQKLLLKIARETLETYLKEKKIPKFNIKDKELKQKLGAFVTLKMNNRLRGCIGEFNPQKPLYQVVQSKIIDAALNDPRFYPVEKKDLKNINIEISVLSPWKKIDYWHKIKLGKQGVVIKNGLRGGTFLPQVATETNWSLENFLSHLCADKAGLAPNCYQDPSTEIFTFTAQVFKE